MPLVAALMTCAVTSFAQPVPLDLHDDMSGKLEDQYTMKATTRYDRAGARLIFDIEYEYKASLLMGEPLQLCSARISNPRGSVRFAYDGEEHTVQIDRSNASLLTPYNLEFAIAYRSIHSDTTYYIARCNTGIPGSWANEAMTVTGSPDWDDFICWHGGRRPSSPDPMPDSVGRDWCTSIGDAESRILGADEAKALFARPTGFFASANPTDAFGERPKPTMRARSVHVASLAVNYSDIVLAETKKLAAQKIAGRRLEQVEQIGKMLPSPPTGAVKQVAELLGEARSAAEAMSDPREQARRLQQALRDVLAIAEEGGQDPAELRKLKDAIVEALSESAERNFMIRTKQALADAHAARDEASQSVDAFLDSHRQAAASASAFAFAGAGLPASGTGPQDIEQEISRIDGHDGGEVNRVAFHPDGRRLLSAGSDKTVRFWDVESGAELWRQSYYSSAIAISPDGRWAVVGARDGEINVLDVETGTIDRRFKNDNSSAYSLAISPDGRYLYSGGWLGFSVADFERRDEIFGYSDKGDGHAAAFSADSTKIAYSTPRSFNYRDIASGRNNYFIDYGLSDTRVNAVFVDTYDGRHRGASSDSNQFIVLENFGRVSFNSYGPRSDGKYAHEKGTQTYLNMDGSGLVLAIAPSSDGRFIISAHGDGSVMLYDRGADKSGESRKIGRHDARRRPLDNPIGFDKTNPNPAWSVAFSPDGRIAASGGADGMIRIWGPKQR